MSEDLERALGPDRRTFVKRLVIGTAFAAPIVSSFTMTGVKAVFGATPGAVTAGLNCNTTQPPAPEGFPTEIACITLDKTAVSNGVDESFPDGGVLLNLVIPPEALPPNTTVCIYRGDLASLASLFPADHPPLSAYAVVWEICEIPANPDALSPITLNVTGASGVEAGDPVYEIDKTSGDPVATNTASGPGAWSASFTKDPGLVVTDAPASAASPVVAQATTTG
jgi:hypothetical protein